MSVFITKIRKIKTEFTLRTSAEFCCALWFRGIKNDAKQSYSKTVLLPQTNFPTRLSGKERVEMDAYLIEVSLLSLFTFLFLKFSSQNSILLKSIFKSTVQQ